MQLAVSLQFSEKDLSKGSWIIVQIGLIMLVRIQLEGALGNIRMKPVKAIAEAGTDVNYSCCTDKVRSSLNWYWADTKQKSSTQELVYNGRVVAGMKNGFNVSEHFNDAQKCSILTVKRSSLLNGGSLICLEMNGDSKYANATLSVIDGMTCESLCFDDKIWVRCSFRYWGEHNLIPYIKLSNTSEIRAHVMSESYNVENHCMEQTFAEVHNVSCQSLHQTPLSVVIKDSKGDASSPPFNISVDMVYVHKTDEAFMTENRTTELPTDNEIYSDRRQLIAVILCLAAFCVILIFILIRMIFVLKRKNLERKRGSKSSEELAQSHRTENSHKVVAPSNKYDRDIATCLTSPEDLHIVVRVGEQDLVGQLYLESCTNAEDEAVPHRNATSSSIDVSDNGFYFPVGIGKVPERESHERLFNAHRQWVRKNNKENKLML